MRKVSWEEKLGMTQVFTEDGNVVPVTVIEAGPCVVLQKKDEENDGYEADPARICRQERAACEQTGIGPCEKSGTTPKRYIKEIRGVNLGEYRSWPGDQSRHFRGRRIC